MGRRPGGTVEFLGRADRMFSVSGQLVSAAEVRSVLDDLHRDLEAVADELRMHVHATLGGLAEPQHVLVLDTFPPDVAEADLHRALQALAASAPRLLQVTAEQVRATARGVAGT